jgi:hypothetical protein
MIPDREQGGLMKGSANLASNETDRESEISLTGGAQQGESSFFEVSKVVESLEMLEPMVDWFRRLDIPCVIEKRRHGYILWRKGVETGGAEPTPFSELKEKKLVSFFGM